MQMQSYDWEKQLQLSCRRILRCETCSLGLGIVGANERRGYHWKSVTLCRYIALTAEKLAQDGADIDDDDDDDGEDDDDEEEDGGAAHVSGSSFAAAEDYEHLRDIDEDEDDIDEDDEEVRQGRGAVLMMPDCDYRSSR